MTITVLVCRPDGTETLEQREVAEGYLIAQEISKA